MNDPRQRWFRKWDLVTIPALLMLAGTLYRMAQHPMQWDQNTADIADLRPRVTALEKVVAEDRAVNQTQMTLILRELDGIHRDVKIVRDSPRAEFRTEEVAKKG